MEKRNLGGLWPVSSLSLGGGGIGQVWGETTREEAIATTRAAVDAGITLLDMAPGYGRGEAEMVIGEAFGGQLPDGVRVTTKYQLGSPAAAEVYSKMEASLRRSLDHMKLDRVDLFFLHSNICPDDYLYPRFAERQDRFATRWSLYLDAVIPAMERLQSAGLIGAWGITGTGIPLVVRQALAEETRPAVVQAVANVMDAVGNMKMYDEPGEPRAIIEAARRNGIGVMGIRAVAAGSLCASIDRALPEDEATVVDYQAAAGFRALCDAWGEDPAVLAHRYALSMPGVDTVVLGVKNRVELAACVEAAKRGPLSDAEVASIDGLGLKRA
ncbi:aldo/keto reductase [Iodidimonas sp. SYSU 1G8]|uniref:aldo/keto reductase n=1 Tax=Iodidimonas sp. SYSU 1G8 TaxID=3133967 RepID=UPI0031FE877F